MDLVREIEVLADAHVTLLADRRKFRPYGVQGGADGAAGCPSIRDGGGEASLPGQVPPQCFRGEHDARLKHRAETGGAKVKQR
jgi:N-methylhydantoinase B